MSFLQLKGDYRRGFHTAVPPEAQRPTKVFLLLRQTATSAKPRSAQAKTACRTDIALDLHGRCPMAETDKAFTGSIAEAYERLLVPLIFAPYAQDLAGH